LCGDVIGYPGFGRKLAKQFRVSRPVPKSSVSNSGDAICALCGMSPE
jgi:hypothetical protein